LKQNSKDKILFVLTLLAALFTLQPILADFKTVGYSIGNFNFTLERLYYLVGALLGISVYFYAITFVTERFSFITQKIGNFFYAVSLVVIPLYFLIWIGLNLLHAIPSYKPNSTVVAIISSLLGTIVSAIVTRALTRRDRDIAVKNLTTEELSHFDRAFEMLKTGYYDLTLLECYRAVETSLQKLFANRQIYFNARRPMEIVTLALKHKLISADVAGAIDGLRKLRNEAVHSENPVDRATAENAFNQAKFILNALESTESDEQER
jgi:HEPN domain-containing protein